VNARADQLRRGAGVAYGMLHVLVLGVALSVPVYAIVRALMTLAGAPGTDADAAGLARDLDRWQILLRNTGIVAGVAVLTAVGLGGGLGLLAARTDLPGRRLVLGAALLGACIPIYVTSALILATLPATYLSGSLVACGVIYGLVYTPLATLVLAAAVRATDRELEDLALLDARPAYVLWRVTVPQAAWGVVAVVLVVVLLVGTDYTIADLLVIRTFAEEVYTQYQLDRRQAGPLLTSLPVLVVMTTLLLAAQARYRFFGEHSPWSGGGAPRLYRLGRARPWATLACAVLLVGVGGGLLTALLLRALAPAPHLPQTGVWGAAWALRHEVAMSCSLAALGAVAVTLPAVGLASVLARGGWLRWVVLAASVLLLSTPAPVVGISLIELLNRPGLVGLTYDTPVPVLLGYLVRFLPIAVLLLVPGLRRIPAEVIWAARVDGCDWRRWQWHIVWPALARDLLLTGLLMLILCFGEVAATMLLVPPGLETAAVRAFTLMHFGVYRDLAVLALVSIVCVLGPWAGLAWLVRQQARPQAVAFVAPRA
jgi:iron(III) transport system permease protein